MTFQPKPPSTMHAGTTKPGHQIHSIAQGFTKTFRGAHHKFTSSFNSSCNTLTDKLSSFEQALCHGTDTVSEHFDHLAKELDRMEDESEESTDAFT